MQSGGLWHLDMSHSSPWNICVIVMYALQKLCRSEGFTCALVHFPGMQPCSRAARLHRSMAPEAYVVTYCRELDFVYLGHYA